jgi:hypothetical protein
MPTSPAHADSGVDGRASAIRLGAWPLIVVAQNGLLSLQGASASTINSLSGEYVAGDTSVTVQGKGVE